MKQNSFLPKLHKTTCIKPLAQVVFTVFLLFFFLNNNYAQNTPSEWKAAGDIYFSESKWQLAADAYTKAMRGGMRMSEIFVQRGRAFDLLAKYDDAITDFDLALQADVKNPAAHYYKGCSNANKEDYLAAEYDFQCTVRMQPNNAEAYNGRGNARAKMGNYKEALEDFNKAIALDPGLVLAYYNRGQLYYETGKYEEAIKDFDQAISLKPDYANAYETRGMSKFMLNPNKNKIIALADIDNALIINTKLASAYNSRGVVKGFYKQYEEAIGDFTKAIELKHQYIYQPFSNRADMYEKLDRCSEAIEDYFRSLRANMKHKNAIDGLARAREKCKA